MAKKLRIRISGSGVVSRVVDGKRLSIPHGDYEGEELDNGDLRLTAGGKAYVVAANDIPQYRQNGTLKSL